MIQKRNNQIKITILIILIIALTAGGTVWFINSRSNNENNTSTREELDFSAKRLIVVTDAELKETYNATNTNITNSGKYVLKYETEEDAKNAYNNFKKDEKIRSVTIDVNAKIKEVSPMITTYTINGITLQSWGVFSMGLDKAQTLINNSTSKEDVVVAVIDTGFDLENATFKSNNLESRIDNRYINIVDGTKNIEDKHSETVNGETSIIGHGTHTGSIVLDGTPNNVKVLPIKVEDDSEEGGLSLTYISEALRYAIDQNVDVINLSLGWERTGTIYDVEIEIQELIAEATQKNITVIAASGNGDASGVRTTSENLYPVSFDNVIGVAALNSNLITTQNGIISLESYVAAKESGATDLIYTDFSNYGATVDYSAPGEYIISLTPTNSIYGESGIVQGTSHASPHIAAAVATLKSYNKDITFAQVNKALEYYSLDLGTTGRDDDYGYGMPCFKNVQECTCNCDKCDKLYCFGCDCDTCLYSLTVEKELDRIEITTNPTKMEYEVGEKFDPTGMVVTAIYTDASQEIITEYTYDPTGTLTKNDNKITVTYQEKNAVLNITVNEPIPEKILEKIEITANPNKMEYLVGEVFDKTGMIVTATYSDSSQETITEYEYAPTGPLTANDNIITITYQGKMAILTITVREKTLEGIEITTKPNKVEYEEGETFDKTGMVVTAIYSDESQETITEYTYAPVGSLTKNDTKITITYKGKTATLNIIVNEAKPTEKTLEKIEISSQPNKLIYNEGEKFDPSGMVVKAIYSDNSKMILSNYEYTPKGNLSKNDTAVIITYQGKTATVNITVLEVKQEERKLERIEITSQPNKTTYTEGEKFDSTGMIITAIYSDGTREIITNYSCFPVAELKQNNKEVTVSYTYNGKTVTAKYPIEVKTQTQNNSGNNNGNSNNNNGGNNNSGTPIGNNNMNFITVKENDNNTSNNNNNKTIPKNTDTDNTIKGGTIANTGLETVIIIPIAIIAVIGTVAFINYKRYKDI